MTYIGSKAFDNLFDARNLNIEDYYPRSFVDCLLSEVTNDVTNDHKCLIILLRINYISCLIYKTKNHLLCYLRFDTTHFLKSPQTRKVNISNKFGKFIIIKNKSIENYRSKD